MPKKSLVRTKAEQCFEQIGRGVPVTCWVDTSQSGKRAKFFARPPLPMELVILRKTFADKFPQQDTRVWYVKPGHSYGCGGIAFKVFRNGN